MVVSMSVMGGDKFIAGYLGLSVGASGMFLQGYLDEKARIDGKVFAFSSGRRIPGKRCGKTYISAGYKCRSGSAGAGSESAKELARRSRIAKGLKLKEDTPPSTKTAMPKLRQDALLTNDPRAEGFYDGALDALGTISDGAGERVSRIKALINDLGFQCVTFDKIGSSLDEKENLINQIKNKDKDVTWANYMEVEEFNTNLLQDLQGKLSRTKSANRKAQLQAQISEVKDVIDDQKKRRLSEMLPRSTAAGTAFPSSGHIGISTMNLTRSTEPWKVNIDAIKNVSNRIFDNPGQASTFAHEVETRQFLDKAGDDALLVYLHEMGHLMQFAARDQAGADVFPKGSLDSAVTSYGKTNNREYFAETFVAWTLDAKRLQATDPQGFELIETAMSALEKKKNG